MSLLDISPRIPLGTFSILLVLFVRSSHFIISVLQSNVNGIRGRLCCIIMTSKWHANHEWMWLHSLKLVRTHTNRHHLFPHHIFLYASIISEERYVWFHLYALYRAMRNKDHAKNYKWKYLSPAGFKPAIFCNTSWRLTPLRHVDMWWVMLKSLSKSSHMNNSNP